MKFFSRKSELTNENESRDFTALFKDKTADLDMVDDINNLREIIQTLLGKLESIEVEKSAMTVKYEGLEEENECLKQRIETLSRNNLAGYPEGEGLIKRTDKTENEQAETRGHGDQNSYTLASDSILEMDALLCRSEGSSLAVGNKNDEIHGYTVSGVQLRFLEEYVSELKRGILAKDTSIRKLQDKETQQKNKLSKLNEELTTLKNLTEYQSQEIVIKNKDIKARLQEISALKRQVKTMRSPCCYKLDQSRESLTRSKTSKPSNTRERMQKKTKAGWYVEYES